MRQIVLDTETTGLETKEGHRIIEIGCVEVFNRRLTGNHFHCYINPEREVDADALAVHGISNAFLQDKPVFSEVAQDFLAFVRGAELIIHNAAFDTNFINHEFRLYDASLGPIEEYCAIVDTLLLARQLHPGQKNNLDALCKRYNIDNSHRELHGALLDAEILALVYLAMTGGQGSLFGKEDQGLAINPSSVQSPQVRQITSRLKVIKATAEEELVHQARLASLQKSAEGGCLWLQIEQAQEVH